MAETIVNEAARRCLGKVELAQALRRSRARTLALFAAYEAALGPALAVPQLPELNPPLWELGHIGWFADWWIARNPQRHRGLRADPDTPRQPARQAVRGVDAEALYHSSVVPHHSRWQLPLPDASSTRADLAASLADTLALLEQAAETDAGLYFFRLALAHEDMHAEAAVYMAQTLGFDPQDALTTARLDSAGNLRSAEIAVPAGVVTLGHSGPGFAFDNELGPQLKAVEGFHIDARPLSWAQFLPFVESGSYAQPRFWSADATPPAAQCPGLGAAALGPLAAGGAGCARLPPELFRGAGLVRLGQPAHAHRGRMGGRQRTTGF